MDNETAGGNYRNRVPGEADNLVYIDRVEEKLKQKGVIHRQIPIKLAFAWTRFKVRISAVVLLKHICKPGMAHVAVSRVTSLSGLHLLDFDGKKMYANPEITGALEAMRQANFDLVMPPFQIEQILNRSDTDCHTLQITDCQLMSMTSRVIMICVSQTFCVSQKLTFEAPLLQTVCIWMAATCSIATDACLTQISQKWPTKVVAE